MEKHKEHSIDSEASEKEQKNKDTICMRSSCTLWTYCRRSALQLSVTGVNHLAVLAANRNRGVGTEAEAFDRQHRASWESNKNKSKVSLKTDVGVTPHFMASARFHWSDLPCCPRAGRRRKRSAGRWSTSCFHRRFPGRGSGPALGRCRRWRCQACTSDWCLEYSRCHQANSKRRTGCSPTMERRLLLTGDLLDVALRLSYVDGGVFVAKADSSDNQQSPQTVGSCKIKYQSSMKQLIVSTHPMNSMSLLFILTVIFHENVCPNSSYLANSVKTFPHISLQKITQVLFFCFALLAI